MSGFISAMSEDSIIQYFGIQLAGGKNAVCHDESVYQNNHLQFGGLQHGAYCHNHFQPAKIADDVAWRAVSLIIVQRLFQHFVLVANTCVVQTASRTYTFLQRDACKASHPQGRRGCVAYPHFSETEYVAAFFVATAHYFSAPLKAKFYFFLGHCSFMQIVARTFTYFHIDDTFLVR